MSKDQSCLKCGCKLSDLDRIHFGMCSTCFSIECNAPDYPKTFKRMKYRIIKEKQVSEVCGKYVTVSRYQVQHSYNWLFWTTWNNYLYGRFDSLENAESFLKAVQESDNYKHKVLKVS